MNLYTDDYQNMYAIASGEGRLWKYNYTIDAEGNVQLGEAIQVEHSFQEVGRSRMFISRQKDTGKVRFTVIASASVLNRVGEIDSTTLFDDFVNRIEQGNAEYPYLTFYHKGEQMRIGQIDMVHRDDNLYINSGEFLSDEEIAPHLRALRDAVIAKSEEDPESLGISIGYRSMDRPQIEEIAGVSIPVFRTGVHVESSILFEEDAASLFTAVAIETNERGHSMSQQLLDKLKKLGLSEAEASEINESIDERNRAITDGNLITRSQEGQGDTEQEELVQPVLEINDEIIDLIASRVRDVMKADMEAMQRANAEELQTLRDALARAEQTQAKAEKIIAESKARETQSVKELISDMPLSRQAPAKVIYRNRGEEVGEEDDSTTHKSLSEVAAAASAAIQSQLNGA